MLKTDKPINITITAGTIFKAVVVLIIFYLLFVMRDLVLVILTSVVIASAIEPATRWFVKKRIPRTLGVLITYILVLAIFAAIFYFFIPPLIQDTTAIVNKLPAYLETLSGAANRFSDIPQVQNFLADLSNGGGEGLLSRIGSGVSTATYGFLSIASSIFGGLLSFVLIIVLSFYLAVQEDGVTNFLKVVVPVKHEKYVIGLWKRSQRKIGLWMQGQLLLGVLIGILTYLGLSILGVENAFILAVIAGIFELIPIFGPILASVPAIAFGLLQGGVTLGLLIIGLYLIIQQFESQLIHPLVVKKMVGIPAMLAIIALIIGAEIAGFLGIILSVPVAAAVMEYVNDVEKRKAAELKEMEA